MTTDLQVLMKQIIKSFTDSAKMQQALVDMLLRRKGLDSRQLQYMDQQVYKEKQFDKNPFFPAKKGSAGRAEP